jgi:hypothetical protein
MAAMTQYFFHFVGEGVYVDAGGQGFSDLISAKAHAARVARELEQDSSDYFGCSIYIANEQGEELDCVSIGADVIKAD